MGEPEEGMEPAHHVPVRASVGVSAGQEQGRENKLDLILQ